MNKELFRQNLLHIVHIYTMFIKYNSMNSILVIAIAASISTATAGILHLNMVPSINTNTTILFIVGGIVQVFWIIPTIKNWGKTWDYIGMAGTVAFILLWIITRLPDNPITGRAGRIGDIAIITEVFQVVFIILLGILIYKKGKVQTVKNNSSRQRECNESY